MVTLAYACIIFRRIHFVLLPWKREDSPSQGTDQCEHPTRRYKASDITVVLPRLHLFSFTFKLYWRSIVFLILKFTGEYMSVYTYKISIYNSTGEKIFGNKRFLETLKLRKQNYFREKWGEIFSCEVVQMPKKNCWRYLLK